ncbi:peptidoglycan DD-metalloendopeptidase family protein [Aeromonas caviae]|uniref:Peptidoglycan DD-metalloendopeptidase family protein n=1 Tax=Aeromonas caviae TaxID=648 RepID=A0ABU5W8X5_AERCA|nr:peptidoglycan DD-metalloendopeptidase family protein [Aeromonas caviae]MBP6791428.1 peptidoglycan DD-metalloendopeptidase family protein [Aeromonas sp.]MBP8280070.1 peptidoglycan DD-metalloendopeptidase family protein [Aeromonas sp.]MEA9426529.1 peptidoglycan DD-metalloendopeptidase family protein [Aeromonas caviae]MEA9436447.1 peptidoglycan DD-metalloendopeptidase family protein [Aeromonas caviae]WEE23080.1 peptidoglycan DD-metalloendopeptidase family protein [Aeromonas caviae]
MVLWHAFNSLPHWHRKMVLILSIMVMMLAAWPSEQAVATRVDDNDNELAVEQQVDEEAQLARAEPVTPPKPRYVTRQVKVRSGDNMGLIFQRLGLSTADLHLIDQLEGTDTLRLLKPGQELTFKLTKGGELHSLYYPHSLEQALKVNRRDDGFVARPVKIELDTREQVAQGEIRSSFWSSAVEAGMTEDQIMDLAAIFGWDIDFAQDLQPGDSFRVVYQDKYQDDERVASGDILAAEFVNQGAIYRAVLNTDGNYYTPDGKAMRKSFLRAPVNFKYISSNFNPRRLHPVTGKVRPHNGIDYVAPVGTPIMAAGGGSVVAAGYNQFNGNYVFIKHAGNYVTKYLHLSKRTVNKGQRVKQGQTIGLLGGTGRVTGPHLHYEFVVGGVHKNPRTLNLPQAESLSGRALASFKAQAMPQLAKLDSPELQLARNKGNGDDS